MQPCSNVNDAPKLAEFDRSGLIQRVLQLVGQCEQETRRPYLDCKILHFNTFYFKALSNCSFFNFNQSHQYWKPAEVFKK